MPHASFAPMPQIYPAQINARNCQLVPFAVLALYALYAFIGQDKPKQTNITASKISAISNEKHLLLDMTLNSGRVRLTNSILLSSIT